MKIHMLMVSRTLIYTHTLLQLLPAANIYLIHKYFTSTDYRLINWLITYIDIKHVNTRLLPSHTTSPGVCMNFTKAWTISLNNYWSFAMNLIHLDEYLLWHTWIICVSYFIFNTIHYLLLDFVMWQCCFILMFVIL